MQACFGQLIHFAQTFHIQDPDIPIADITRQYMEYIGLMQDLRLELAAEYLVMAATLMHIKSRMLLPRPTGDDEDEDDPRAELVRRLQEYERFKQAAEEMDDLPREGRDFVVGGAHVADRKTVQVPPEVGLGDMLDALPHAAQERLATLLDEYLASLDHLDETHDTSLSGEGTEAATMAGRMAATGQRATTAGRSQTLATWS